MTSFDPTILDENSRALLERREEVGQDALALIANGAVEDVETTASDLISDILTAICGPAATYSYTEGDTRYEARTRLAAINAADDLLARALRSWQGDAEDYIEAGSEEDVHHARG